MGQWHIAWRALLQQQLGCANHWLGMEMVSYIAVLHCIQNGHNRHALMMGKIGAHDCHSLAFAQAR
jgi:hypothetical protein